jgi:hypothetical protein
MKKLQLVVFWAILIVSGCGTDRRASACRAGGCDAVNPRLMEHLRENEVIFGASLVEFAPNCSRVGEEESWTGYDECKLYGSRALDEWRNNLRSSVRDTLETRRELGAPGWQNVTHIVVVDEIVGSCSGSYKDCGFKYNFSIVPYSCELRGN